jgi:hypothetical protein
MVKGYTGLLARTRRVVLAAALVAATTGSTAVTAANAANDPTQFGVSSFTTRVVDQDGIDQTQAASHPFSATAAFTLNTRPYRPSDMGANPESLIPVEDPRTVEVDLPPGFVGNPRATSVRCTGDRLQGQTCPVESQVGVARFGYNGSASTAASHYPVYNMVPAPGRPAEFAVNVSGLGLVALLPRVRSDGDYGLTVVVPDTIQSVVFSSTVTFWGTPADPAHDPDRLTCSFFGCSGGLSSTDPLKPFLTNPASECTDVQPVTTLRVNSWQNPGVFKSYTAASPLITGCDKLTFEPAASIVPSTSAPDAPSGLNVDLTFPTADNAEGLAPPALKRAVVMLPEGMTINPAAAGGLVACGDGDLKLKSLDPTVCPEASKVGTVVAKSPLLEETLSGGVYIRSQNSDDPESGEMFRLALVLENEERGISVRLPGSIRADAKTGRLVTTFDNNPELPVESIKLRFKEGSRAPLATPATCGEKTVDTTLTSWGKQTVSRQSSFTVDCRAGLGGFGPAFNAGVVAPVAGGSSPFTVGITKPDGDAALSGLSMVMPTGLLARLKGNLGTQVGTVMAFAGPGSAPFALPGRVYLEGQYGDAPFSLRVVVPAKAGPFDLGEVVVRQKVYVDPIDAHVTVVSDPVPTIVKGVPVRLQRLDVNVDKPGFMLNPTSCEAKAISATLSAAGGQSVPVTNRFQVGECGALDLKPGLALTLSGKGQTTDGKHPAVTADLTQKPGQANLKKVRVALPLSLALDVDNANGLCEFVDGSKVTPTCPKASIVGSATAVTPILDEPMSGPVYFVKNVRTDAKTGRQIKTLPKLVIPLTGQNGLKLTLAGTSDVENDQLVTTFDNIPDAPVSSFKMNINGGKGGILAVSSADICKASQVADQRIDGQNGTVADASVYIRTPSCPLKVLSKKVGKRTVAVKVGGLSAGKVMVTGKGIKKTSKTIVRSTVATVTAKRTKGKPGKVTVSFDPAGPAKARKTSK